MGKSSGSAPAAPDPAQTIPLQAQYAQRAYDQMVNASRVNSAGPTGSQTWNNNPTFDSAAYNLALQNYQRDGSTGAMPDRDQYVKDTWTQTTRLSPEQQQLYDQQVKSQGQQGNLELNAIQRVNTATKQPLSFSGSPGLVGSLDAPDIGAAKLDSSYLKAPSQLQTPNLQANPLGQVNQRALTPGQLSSGVPQALSGFSSQIGALDPGQFNQQAADAIYNQGTRYLDPQLQQQQKSLEARLGEQGFVPGTPAYNQAMQNFQDTSNRAYAQARDQATTAGVNSGQANFGNKLGALQSQISTALQGGNFQNSQQAQNFSQQQAQAGQDRQVGLDRNDVTAANNTQANSVAQQMFQNKDLSQQRAFENQNLVGQQANNIKQQNQTNTNSALQQEFQNNLTGGQFQNQARNQSIAEILQQRNQPLNELAALRTNSPVQMPQGAGVVNTPNLQAPDITGTYQNQYMGQLGSYNAGVAQDNQTLQMLAQLGMMGAFLSDARFKTNIHPLGQTEKGVSIYSYELFGTPSIGVMAQEVQQSLPEAVVEIGPFLAVDYSKVL